MCQVNFVIDDLNSRSYLTIIIFIVTMDTLVKKQY
jgi:hypothetical protein